MKILQSNRNRSLVVATVISLFILVLITGTSFAGKHNHGNRDYFPLDQATIDSLKLTSAQQQSLDNLRNQANAMHEETRVQMKSAKSVFDEERQSDAPDLRRVSQVADQVVESRQNDRRALKESMLDLYDTLDSSQKKIVVDAMDKRFSHHTSRQHQSANDEGAWRLKTSFNQVQPD